MTDQCKLLEGWYAFFIQGLLGLLALSSLLIKRWREIPKRTWTIWMMDVSKQGVSSLCIHFLAIFIALLMSTLTKDTNQCAWYFLIFIIDTILGTLISYGLLILTTKIAIRYKITSLEKSGEYGIPPSKLIWIKQLSVWCIIVLVARGISIFIIWGSPQQLAVFANLIANPFKNKPKLFLGLVMVLCPLIINLIQMWIQDSFLKKKIIISPIIFDIDSNILEESNQDYIPYNEDGSINYEHHSIRNVAA